MDITGERFQGVRRSTIGRIALAVALIVPTAACESSPPVTGGVRLTAEVTSTADQPRETASEVSAVPSEQVLDGRTVRARRSGLSFTAPEGWQAADPATLVSAGADAVPEFFERLAESTGVPVSELAKQMGQATEVIVMGPPANGFAPNIVVVPSSESSLPAPSRIRAQLEGAGATAVQVRERDTALGPARLVSATLQVSSLTVASRSIVVRHDGQVSTITVSTDEPEQADGLLDEVIASLAAL